MLKFYLWTLPLGGLVLIHPLIAEDEAVSEVSGLLGRAGLLDPDKKEEIELPEIPAAPVPLDPADPEGESVEDLNVLPGEEVRDAGVLPEKNETVQKAGNGPGEVSGVIFGEEGQGISGVILIFPEVGGFQTRTGSDGSFQVAGLPAEGVSMELLKPAYQTKVEVLQIKPEGVTKVRISMELKPVELADGEYELDARDVILDYEEDPLGVVMLGNAQGASFVSGIGKDDFVKQSVSNAADAVGRVSGANIVDGKYAVVRGLADRYVTTSFNNGAITSADPSRKAVQLDLFPTSVLEGIGVKKVYDASMPGDFGGGAINIQTLAMPEERFLKLSYGLGWNSNLEGGFIRSRRDIGFLGDIDNPVPRSEIFDADGNFSGGSGSDVPDLQAAASWDRLLSQTRFLGRQSSPRPAQKFGITYGDRFELSEDIRLGIVASVSRSEQDRMQLNRVRSRPGIQRSWVQDDFSSEVDWGLFLSGQLEVGDRHKIRASYFRKHVAEDNFSLQRDIVDQANGINFGVLASRVARDGLPAIPGVRPAVPGYGADAYYKGEVWQTDTTIRDLELFQFSGEHELWEDGLKVDWGFTRNNSSESRPYSTSLRYGVLDFADPRLAPSGDPLLEAAGSLNNTFNLGLTDPSFDQVANELRARMILGAGLERFLDTIRESALANVPIYKPELGQVPTLGNVEYTGDSPGALVSEILNQRIQEVTTEMYADAIMPFKLGERDEFRLGAGFRSSRKKRESRGQRYIIDANDLPDEILYQPGGLGTQIPLNPALFPNGTDGSQNGITLEDGNALEVRNFDGNSRLLALYLKGELDWGDYTVGAGLRREEETRGFFTLPAPLNLSTTANKSGEVTNVTNIPSLYLKRSFNDDQFRVGGFFSRTVARPTFFEFLPAKSIEQDTGFERRGDFALRDTTITNFDLTFEWDITPDSRITFAPFYKHLEDPIISVVRRSQQFIGFQNAEEGTLKGVELEFEIGEFAPFTLKGNYTFIDAELVAEINTGVGGFQPVDLQYPNQPEHILNLSLGYENEETGWSGNLVYNFTGENALFLRIRESDANVITPSYQTFDFNIQKKFTWNELDVSLGLTVKNIFDTKTKVFFEGGGTDFANETFDVRDSGRTISLEGKIEF